MVKTVVCIEDEEDIIELLSNVLDSDSIELVSTTTAFEGLAAVRRVRPALVILDIVLPDTDGWSVYDAIRSDPTLRNTPVVMLTALRREFQPRRTFRPGPHDAYIMKPFDAPQLRAQIEQMLDQKIW
jgi:CheY-like chemotaxis protein